MVACVCVDGKVLVYFLSSAREQEQHNPVMQNILVMSSNLYHKKHNSLSN